MRARGWTCMKLGGGKYTIGWPDWYCFHISYGHRWIETKKPGGKLRKSQIDRFIIMSKGGDSIWVLRDERDYNTLFKDIPGGNWGEYI